AADPEVPPAWVLPRHSDDQLAAVVGELRLSKPWPPRVRRPFPPAQVARRAQHSLGSNQQGSPSRPREPLAVRRQDHAIRRGSLDPLDLALEHLDLPPQNQHLSLELGLLLPAC